MRWILFAFVLSGVLPAMAVATPIRTAHYEEISIRQYSERQDQCHLMYYNVCSGWVRTWNGYCYGSFPDCSPQYGTCFDLGDCAGHCRHLEDVWWAARGFPCYTDVDVEIYCTDENGCPVGTPLAGIYGYVIRDYIGWHRFDFGGLPLCGCENSGGRFTVLITPQTGCIEPYSDLNHRNISEGCEDQWRCSGHSYVYRNVVAYCELYGAPGPLWNDGADYGCTNYPAIPPGCHNYNTDTGYYAEWLIDCYVSCQGPTQTEKESWSEIKALYR